VECGAQERAQDPGRCPSNMPNVALSAGLGAALGVTGVIAIACAVVAWLLYRSRRKVLKETREQKKDEDLRSLVLQVAYMEDVPGAPRSQVRSRACIAAPYCVNASAGCDRRPAHTLGAAAVSASMQVTR
jgi:hypothetical protein